MVCYSDGPDHLITDHLNSEILVRYSGHSLNNELKVPQGKNNWKSSCTYFRPDQIRVSPFCEDGRLCWSIEHRDQNRRRLCNGSESQHSLHSCCKCRQICPVKEKFRGYRCGEKNTFSNSFSKISKPWWLESYRRSVIILITCNRWIKSCLGRLYQLWACSMFIWSLLPQTCLISMRTTQIRTSPRAT